MVSEEVLGAHDASSSKGYVPKLVLRRRHLVMSSIITDYQIMPALHVYKNVMNETLPKL